MVGWIAPGFTGQVDIGQAGLSWFAPVKIENVAVKDSDGNVAIAVPLVETDCTLWQLATGRYENATVVIDSPTANWNLQHGGSNLEELLQPFMQPSEEPTGPAKQSLKVEVQNGQLTITQTETGSRSQIRKIDCTIDQKKGVTVPEIQMSGVWSAVTADEDIPGSSSITASLTHVGVVSESTTTSETASWHLEADQLAAGFLNPVLQRFYPQAQLSGIVNADVQFDQPVESVDRSFLAYGHIDCRNLVATVPEVFYGDRLFFDAIDIDGRVDVEGSTLSFDNLDVNSSILKLSADGDARLPGGTGAVNENVDLTMGRELEIVAVVDLPSMATMMPETLHLHPDMRVDAGRLLAQVGTKSTNETRNWITRLKVTQISGRHQDKTIQWEDPVSVELAASQTKQGITIDRLACDSEFMKVSGSGDTRHAEFKGNCNLNVLMQNVSQFVDLGRQTIAGQMRFDGRWDRVADNQSTITANATVNDFLLKATGQQPWREKQLELSLSGLGVANLSQVEQVSQLKFALQSDSDRMTVALVEPWTLSEPKPIPLQMKLSGNLNSWAARTSPLVDWGTWRPNGRANVAGRIAVSNSGVRVVEATLVADDFSLANGDLVVQDTHLDGKVTANFEYATQHGYANVSLVGRDLSCSAENVEFTLGDQMNMKGRLRVDSRLSHSLKLTSGLRVGGVLSSKVELSNSGGGSEFSILGTIQDLQFVRPLSGRTRIAGTDAVLSPKQWVEPEVRFAAQGQFAKQVFSLAGLSLKASGMGITGKGSTSPGSNGLQTDFSGEFGYDLAEISKALEVALGIEVRATGTGRQPFQIRGPLVPAANSTGMVSAELQASFGLDWKSAGIDQIQVGEGELQARLQKQILRFAPTSVTIRNAGVLNIRPVIAFDAGEPVLHLNQSTSLDNAVITPEIANQWVGYVAPLLANTADVDGRFSARLSRAVIPLWNTAASDVSGQLQIESADARPGPAAIELVQVIQKLRALLDRSGSNSSIQGKSLIHMDRQTAEFRLVDGRVHHRGVSFVVDGVSIQTSGSVGLDQTLSITAVVPIRDSWVAKDKVLSRLAGKTLSIPISGTAQRPRVDSRIIADLARQIGQSATQGVIEDKLNGTLEDLGKKLFGN